MERLDPTNRVMAVVDDPAAADAAVRDLRDRGISAADITLLAGSEAAALIDPAGRRGGRWLRIKRIVALTQADQSVDLVTYEAALRDGRPVLAIRAAEHRATAVEVLRESGAHFVNHYGLLVTEEIIPWRGDRLPLPHSLLR